MNRKSTLSINQIVQGQYFRWRLTRRGSGVYYADGRGNEVNLGRLSLGTKDREQAVQNLRQLDLKMAVQHGKADASMMTLSSGQMLPLRQGQQWYLEHVGGPAVTGGSRKAKQRYQAVFDKFADFAGEQRITYWQQVTTSSLRAYAKWLDEREYAYATQYLELTTLKQALKYLREDREVPGIPAASLKMQKVQSTSTYCYSHEQVVAMIDHCRQDPTLQWMSHVITALATTGLRISELASLRWSDLDLDQGALHLPDRSRHGSRKQREHARTTKGRRDRELPIHDRLRQVLEEIEHLPDGRVFHGPRGGKLKPDTVLSVLKRDVIKPLASRFPSPPGEPGFKDGKVHSLRHYFCSACANSGVPEQMLMQWLGHRDSKMVRRYYHGDREAAKQWLSKVNFTGDPAA